MHHDSTPTTVDLGNNNIVILDAGDAGRVTARSWYRSRSKQRPDYMISQTGGRGNITTTYLHRFIIDAPRGSIVDHANGDTMDNRRSNLRIASHQQNMSNSQRRKTNTSGYKGVQLRCDGKKWLARIQVNKKTIHLGSFETREDAARAYDAAAIQHFGEFARLNFP